LQQFYSAVLDKTAAGRTRYEKSAMRKVLIAGNSGSGKSTLAKSLHQSQGLAHLDLDTLAWQPVSPPERRPLEESAREIKAFTAANNSWVIEGCYADLLEIAAPASNEFIFMNLPVEACIANARNRAWEPHKYASKAAQDANLQMLIDWIAAYPTRSGVFSQAAHTALYEAYPHKKSMRVENQQA